MKYLLTNIRIIQTKAVNPQRYIHAELQNVDDPSLLRTTYLFGKEMIAAYEAALKEANGDINNIPNDMKYFEVEDYKIGDYVHKGHCESSLDDISTGL